MHVLTKFLNQCVPDITHILYNSAINIMIQYRDTANYDILVQLVADDSGVYPEYFRDEVNNILHDSMTKIIHDHGMIAEGELPDLIKLADSLLNLTNSPDLDAINNALTAFPDNATYCMQRVLELHNGLDDFTFNQIVRLVTPSCIDRLEQHRLKTEELLESELDQLEEDIAPVTLSLEVQSEKKEWLIKHRDAGDMQPIVTKYIVEQKGSMGRDYKDLIELLHSDLVELQPTDPVQAGKTLVALAVLSSSKTSEAYVVAKESIDSVYDDVGFVLKVRSAIDDLSVGE